MKAYRDITGEGAEATRRKYADVAVRVPAPIVDSLGGKAILCQCKTTTTALGPRDSGGVEYEGDGYVVDYLVTGASGPDTPTTITLSGKYSRGLTFPNEYVWARKSNGKYWIIQGSETFSGSPAADMPNGVGDVTIRGVDIACVDDCGETIVQNTKLKLQLELDSGSGCIVYVVKTCCADIGDL